MIIGFKIVHCNIFDCLQLIVLTGRKEGRKEGRTEGNVLFKDALNRFYLLLYGVTHMVKDSAYCKTQT